jgi:hypothetical protein
MDSTKERIKKVVREYIRMFPFEYEQFLISHRQKQENKINEFAEFKQHDQLVRHLFDIPESLYLACKMKLQDEQFDWLFGTGTYEGNYVGITWFIKMFPQFKITKDF